MSNVFWLMLAIVVGQGRQYPREITIPAGPPAQTAPEKSPRQDKGPARYPKHHAGKTIYFIPIGDFPSGAVEDLVSYYRETLHLEINTVDPISIEDSVLDTERRQLVAEKLIASMRHALPKLASDPNALLIGFTTTDMYPLGENWRFAFGWRVTELRAAVVSTARMDLHYPGEPLDDARPEIRLRKMVTKDIGILYYGLPQSSNPRSVLYNHILGIEELDAMGERF